jgi:hypothetical protein
MMEKDIIELVKDAEEKACRDARTGVIISPGAIGDCLLMLPLAKFMKEVLQLGGIDFIGHTDYIEFYPGRTVVDGIRSIDSIDFHRLFAKSDDLVIEDDDPLINTFSRYEWIASFLGKKNSHFESNLIFTVYCSRSAEITMLPVNPEPDLSGHISEFYIRKFIENNLHIDKPYDFDNSDILIKPTQTDIQLGNKLLQDEGIDTAGRIAIIHPGSGSQNKCWHLGNFCLLAEILSEKGLQVVFLMGPAEKERFDQKAIEEINTAAKCISGLDLTALLQVIACGDLFIGNDSGITHLAAGIGTKTLAVFGPTNPVLYKPIGPCVRLLKSGSDGFACLSPATVHQGADILLEMLDN